jgi:hypothetical protein
MQHTEAGELRIEPMCPQDRLHLGKYFFDR